MSRRISSNREYITAISIDMGIITLIEPDGQVAMYRQRGLGSLTSIQQDMLVNRGLLHKDWKKVKELPRNWSISFEDEEIMGKARATFPFVNQLIKQGNAKR